ncbi:hypothetical protein EDD15DRAFT_2266110 [Pisolithus albus]|nr:hypothetical protein EDD15DRAFT_2266110 [Pisolithus albus]
MLPLPFSKDSAANIVLRRAPKSSHSLRSLHNASKRSTVALVVDAPCLTYDSARTPLDLDLDREYGVFAADVEQCARPVICSSPLPWLTKGSSALPAWVSSTAPHIGTLVGLCQVAV